MTDEAPNFEVPPIGVWNGKINEGPSATGMIFKPFALFLYQTWHDMPDASMVCVLRKEDLEVMVEAMIGRPALKVGTGIRIKLPTRAECAMVPQIAPDQPAVRIVRERVVETVYIPDPVYAPWKPKRFIARWCLNIANWFDQ